MAGPAKYRYRQHPNGYQVYMNTGRIAPVAFVHKARNHHNGKLNRWAFVGDDEKRTFATREAAADAAVEAAKAGA